jgi:hypothetical protein
MKSYKVINIQNISDGRGSFEVNDAHYTGDTVELEEPTLANVLQALKDIGRLKSQHQARHFEIAESDDAGSLTLRRKSDGYWFYELRPSTLETVPTNLPPVLKDALYNLHPDSGSSPEHAKGILVGAIAAVMQVNQCEWAEAMRLVGKHLPNRVMRDAVPPSWIDSIEDHRLV